MHNVGQKTGTIIKVIIIQKYMIDKIAFSKKIIRILLKMYIYKLSINNILDHSK